MILPYSIWLRCVLDIYDDNNLILQSNREISVELCTTNGL
jgi:hypothetical protein